MKNINDNRPLLKESEFFKKIIGMALGFRFDDSVWKYFGFNKVPKRGRLFNIFVSNEKLRKEKFIGRELVILFFYLSVYFYKSESNLNDQYNCAKNLVRYFFSISGDADSLALSFDFDNYKSAEIYFQQHLDDYFKNGIVSVSNTFLFHAKHENVSLNMQALSVSFVAIDISSSFVSGYKEKYCIVSDF